MRVQDVPSVAIADRGFFFFRKGFHKGFSEEIRWSFDGDRRHKSVCGKDMSVHGRRIHKTAAKGSASGRRKLKENVRRILEKLNSDTGGEGISLKAEEIALLLALEDFTPVYRAADKLRRDNVGDTVHLRAIIEFSNICRRRCRYCGLNRENRALERFRMTPEEIVSTAKEAVAAGYRTIVLQSGEDDWFNAVRLGDIISEIKSLKLPQISAGKAVEKAGCGGAEHPAVTVSCGEMSREDYAYLRKAGADRYLLKHETADAELYDRLHPCGTLAARIDCLKTIHELGYDTGSGFMVGLPGQTLKNIAEDLLLLKAIPCQMAGIGPFISNPRTELAGEKNGEPELTRRAVAMARLLLPMANLPVTTALSILSREEDRKAGTKEIAEGVENPFAFGANVVMKKVTPDKYKAAYEIYPADFEKTEILKNRQELEATIRSCGRVPL